jgi:hypothetical protein
VKVYVLEGWFGDHEWIEGIYADSGKAEERCTDLWNSRSSDRAPEWCQGLCKFAVEPVEVIE